MNYAIGDVYILLEDLDMCNDNYGFRAGGGTAKAGQRFELLDSPDCKKEEVYITFFRCEISLSFIFKRK